MPFFCFQVDLVGGYYDAGDNMKFGLPMAFTTTMLAWSIIEFGGFMQSELGNAKAALRWGSDYLLKAATATPGTLYVQVRSSRVRLRVSDHHFCSMHVSVQLQFTNLLLFPNLKQVGEANSDHQCWERPEDMDTSRGVYKVSAQNPGSDVAAETAAALAAASIVFQDSEPSYSQKLLQTAMNVLIYSSQLS